MPEKTTPCAFWDQMVWEKYYVHYISLRTQKWRLAHESYTRIFVVRLVVRPLIFWCPSRASKMLKIMRRITILHLQQREECLTSIWQWSAYWTMIIIKICSSSLCTCLHHMVILRTRNKITDFLMILAWASPFNLYDVINKYVLHMWPLRYKYFLKAN